MKRKEPDEPTAGASTRDTKTKLTDLPFELLDAICQPVDRVQTLSHLSQTCSTMHTYVQRRGWSNFLRDRLYIKNQFTRNQFPVDALRDITSLSRNLDRRSFHARTLIEPKYVYETPMLYYGQSSSTRNWNAGSNPVEPFASRMPQYNQYQGSNRGYAGYGGYGSSSMRPPPHLAPTRLRANHPISRAVPQQDRQSVGYAPQIDSYEYTGWQWDSRKEVVAWGAGSRLLMRQVFKGKDALRLWIGAKQSQSESEAFDRCEHFHRWFHYEKPGSKQGIDDITSLNLLDYAKNSDSNEHVIVGRASGGVDLLVSNSHTRTWTELPLETQGSKVKGTSVGRIGDDVLVSAVFGDKTVALYAVDFPHRPAAITTLGPFKANTWSSSFVGNKLAIGFGPSTAPVKIFEATPHGLGNEPIRSFDVAQSIHHSGDSHRSVNAILPSTNAPMLGGSPGDLFFAGCYDGDCLLLDARSDKEYATRYSDPIDTSTIYSLAVMGGHKLLAGASRHSMIKVFDLRMPGRTTYYNNSKKEEAGSQAVFDNISEENYSLYFDTTQERELIQEPRHQRRRRTARQKESAVYSLSVPSSTSSTVYAGPEGRVIQMDAIPTTDHIPEPTDLPRQQQVSMYPAEPSSSDALRIRRGIDGKVFLKMVDHRSGVLLHQKGSTARHASEAQLPGLNMDPSWYITSQPPEPTLDVHPSWHVN